MEPTRPTNEDGGGDFDPDKDLRLRVLLFLAQKGHPPLRKLAVEAHAGVVTIRGVLPTFYLRQQAIACAQHVAGVLSVIDETRILAATSSDQSRWRSNP